MNQNLSTERGNAGTACPPSYQAEVFNPFVVQPAPPRHSHAAPLRRARRPPAREGAAAAGAVGTGARAGAGRAGGGGRWSETEWKREAGAEPARAGSAPRDGSSGRRGSGSRRSGSARATLRRRPRPRPRSERALPGPPPGPFVCGEPVVVAAAAQDAQTGSWEAACSPLLKQNMRRKILLFNVGTWPAFSYRHTYFFLTGPFPKKFNSKSLAKDIKDELKTSFVY